MLPIEITNPADLEAIAVEARAGKEIEVGPPEPNHQRRIRKEDLQFRSRGVQEALLGQWPGRHRPDDADGGEDPRFRGQDEPRDAVVGWH
jgi:hypothetical protein